MMTIAQIEAKMSQAKANPGKAVRVCAGYYFIMTSQGLAEIDQVVASQDDTDWSGWVSKAVSRAWVNDPVQTLGQAILDCQNL